MYSDSVSIELNKCADLDQPSLSTKISEQISRTEKKRKSSFMELEMIPENATISKRTSIRKPSNELTDSKI